MDSAESSKKQPDLNPSHELPIPHDMELPQPHDMLLKPHLTHRHPWLHWMPALLGLIIGIWVGVFLVGGAENNRKQINQYVNYQTTTPIAPTTNPSLTPTPANCTSWETVCDPAYPNEGCRPLKICVSPTSAGQVYCTQEAKQCPDGSWVGRTGPNCEFSPCSTQQP